MMHTVANGHEIVALANLKPLAESGKDELDSYMYQTVGHDAIELYAGCMNLPLFRREIRGSSKEQGADYMPTLDDEVEDLFALLSDVKASIPEVEAVATGAILSNYQRVRVENVCLRLGLTSLAYLWRRDQKHLMEEMIESGLHAVIIKVAAMGLKEAHLGKSLQQMYPHLVQMHERYEGHICGEGGEFETFTLDCPLFVKRIVLEEVERVVHSDDAFAVVAYLRLKKARLEDKLEPGAGTLGENLRRKLVHSKPEPAVSDDLYFVLTVMYLKRELYAKGVKQRTLPVVDAEGMSTSGSGTQVSSPHVHWRNPYFALSGTTIHHSILRVSLNHSITIEEEAAAVMDTVQATLQSHNLTWGDVTLMHVYVRDMTCFARLNADPQPPIVRVTVEASLPENVQVQIDCLAFKAPDAAWKKETMHVQSVSYWAPANIGQAALVPRHPKPQVADHIYVAGQIGLIPNTMQVPFCIDDLSSLVAEATTSLTSLNAIVTALNADMKRDAACCVCYVTDARYLGVAERVWEMAVEKYANRQGVPPIPSCFVAIPALPRGAKIEWQVMFTNRSKNWLFRPGRAGRQQEDESDDEDPMKHSLDVEEPVTLHVESEQNSVKCSVDAWSRGSLCTLVGIIKVAASSVVASEFGSAARDLQHLIASSFAQLRRGESGASWTWEDGVSMRVFYDARFPRHCIETGLGEIKAKNEGPAVTLVPVTAMPQDVILSICIHAALQ
ncbi:ATP binding domain 4 [Borealophlyctis nickersoniae]|nr:ATP binding domain 4 [Borealophlyctis nickersoniae]